MTSTVDKQLTMRTDVMSQRRYQAAIFDCDGLLIDTKACWVQAFEHASGHELNYDVLRALVGSSTRTGALRLSEIFDVDVRAVDVERELERCAQERTFAPLPGVETLLEHLAGRIPMAVATNGPAKFVTAALGSLARFFAHVVTSQEAGADKPEPTVYLAACGRLGVDPGRAVAFEDSAIGARSALAAGIDLVAINSKGILDLNDDGVPRLLVRRADDPELIAFLDRALVG